MKILILSPFFPYPPDSGAKIRTYNIIRSLQGHNITLLTFSDHKAAFWLEELNKYCSAVYIYPWPKISFNRIFLNYFSLKPFLAVRFFNLNLFNKLKEIGNDFDLAIFESLLMAEYESALTKPCKVLDELNLEFVRAHRRINNTSIIKKIYYYMIFYRLKRYELKIIRNFDFILVCSDHDQSLLEKYQPHKKIAVVPNVVDPDYFYPNERMARSNKILFVGTMWYEPNADAIKFFIHQVFPLIKREINDVELLIIGDGATKEVLKYSRDPAIKIVNYVDDIRPYFEESKVLIAPIRMGSGTRLKILTAMAMNLPVVSTTIGCEGLDVENGVNVIIADETLEMKESLIKILKDKDLRQRLGQKGRELVEKRYSINSLRGLLNRIFDEIMRKK